MGGWTTSDRRSHLPPNWRALRESILERDSHRCTSTSPIDGERCPELATEVDHLGERDDHRPRMLTSICEWHHGKKSGAQGARAMWKKRQQHESKFRRSESHPGLL